MIKKIAIALIVCIIIPLTCYATTYYYVHPGLGTGSNNGSSWGDAWQNFSNVMWSTLESDAISQPVYLYIKKGITTNTVIAPTGSGSSDTNRIIITTDPGDSGENPILSGATSSPISANGESYLTFQNIEVTNASTGVRLVHVTDSSSYLVFDNLIVHDTIGPGITTTQGGTPNVTVSNTSVYNIYGVGASTYDGLVVGGDNLYVSNVLIYNICEDAMSVNGDDIVLDNIEIYNTGFSTQDCTDSHPDAIVIGPGEDAKLTGLYIHDLVSQGIFLAPSTGTRNGTIEISNSVFESVPGGHGAINIKEDGGALSGVLNIYHNTFINNTNGAFEIQNGSFSEINIRNNIMWGNGGGFAIPSSLTSVTTSDYNMLESAMNWGGASYTSLSTWQSASGQDDNSMWETDPSLDSEYRPNSQNDPPVAAGTYLVEVATDKDGVSRINPPSIGAYEFTQYPSASGITFSGVTIGQ
jgi:hypothetical protein